MGQMSQTFRSSPAFGRFWAARTASYLGDFITLTALILYLQESGHGPADIALALIARALPQALGPFAGALADLVDARKLMIACDVGRLILIGALAVTLPPFPVMLALLALASLLSTAFLPAGKSTVPKLVGSEQLGTANALLAMSHNLSLAVGPVVSALVFTQAGARAAFAVDALSYGVSLLLLLGVPALPAAKRTAERASAARFLRDMREGLGYVARHRIARAVTLGLFLGISLAGLDNVALVFLLREDLNAGPQALGIATGVYGAAMIVAPLLLLRAGKLSSDWYFVAGLAASGLGLLLTGISPTVWLCIVCYAVAGIGNGLENVACDTLLGRTVPEHLLGRVFGAVYGPIFLAETAAAALGSALLTVMSPGTVFVAAGTGLLLLSVGVRVLIPRGTERSESNASTQPVPD
ncbi:Putative bacilysin exporter BacE [Streptomyces xanthophaeus]|nr:Putative bacilysin exporter BacE [Streptomyces xanthophaeus]